VHPNETAINDFVDGTGDPFERTSVEQHITTCAECRQVVEDVREIKRATGALELREPPVRVWGRIERAITLERDADGAREGVARRLQPSDGSSGPAKAGHYVPTSGLKRGTTPYWLAAAAAIVLATVIGLRFVPGRDEAGNPPKAAETASAGGAAQSIESELRLAEAHYEKAIKGLEQIANSDQGALDPKTAATLQKNLAVIDQAISESRAAMRAQPANEPAQQSLVENFKSKIALLQDTVALINEMRKGNEAGAARIVSGLKQKGN
jgi:anti-sigma factor RsiW